MLDAVNTELEEMMARWESLSVEDKRKILWEPHYNNHKPYNFYIKSMPVTSEVLGDLTETECHLLKQYRTVKRKQIEEDKTVLDILTIAHKYIEFLLSLDNLGKEGTAQLNTDSKDLPEFQLNKFCEKHSYEVNYVKIALPLVNAIYTTLKETPHERICPSDKIIGKLLTRSPYKKESND